MRKYTLIITEKPDAAKRIAAALDVDGEERKTVQSGVPFYQACRNGDLIVVPALGHLYTVADKRGSQAGYPVFEYDWVPRHLAERNAAKIRVWLKVIAELAEDAETFVDACDYDIEGSLIGYCILRFACGGKEQIARRMKYSTLTREELQESYANLLPHLDFALVQAGLTRHEVDWLYGINLSRALTSALKNASGRYALLSTGRVQGPTLKFLEERERAIRCFVPTPYWTLTAKVNIEGTDCEAGYERILDTQQEAKEVLTACKERNGQIETVTVEEFCQRPPFPFDLGTLQSEAYRIFKYAPVRTSSIAQRLYMDALISYPRTSSQKLPPAINYKSILRKLAKLPSYARQTAELLSKSVLKPNEGEKVDSAHPAIFPTGNLPEKTLGPAERNIFDLVIRRFMATFGDPAIRQSVKATLDISGNKFFLDGMRTLSEGWIRLYEPYAQSKDAFLPPLVQGQTINVKRISLKEEFTRPPARYNPSSLLWKMEKENIGTKATRAAIVQTLSDRKYLCGTDRFSVSNLGFEVAGILTEFCPTIVSPELTMSLEQEMDAIQDSRETREAVLQRAVSILKPVMMELKVKEPVIGERLDKTQNEARLGERTVGKCPKCAEGKLIILRSKKTGKRFVGCTGHFEGKCDVAFPLPQKGSVKPSNNQCKSCGYPMVNVWLRGKHPWKLCLNPSCPSKGVNKTIEM